MARRVQRLPFVLRRRPGLARELHVQQRVLRIVAAAPGNHRNPAARSLDAQIDHAVMFLVGQGRGFAGGPAGDKSMGSLFDLPFHKMEYVPAIFVSFTNSPISLPIKSYTANRTIEIDGISY